MDRVFRPVSQRLAARAATLRLIAAGIATVGVIGAYLAYLAPRQRYSHDRRRGPAGTRDLRRQSRSGRPSPRSPRRRRLQTPRTAGTPHPPTPKRAIPAGKPAAPTRNDDGWYLITTV